MAGWLVRKLLTLDYADVSLERPHVHVDARLRSRLEEVPTRFLDGYHVALEADDLDEIAARIDRAVPRAFQGFAYEGAGMCLALLDLMGLTRNRARRFVETAGARHDYIICVGAGFAMARLPWARWSPRRVAERFPPGLSSLVIDGYGFHEGFFRPAATVGRWRIPWGVAADMRRYFDNGVGRALWFVEGASPDRIGAAIRRFPANRQPHLWAGLGLACAYAGMVYADVDEYAAVLTQLRAAAGAHAPQLALGTVLAAEAMRKADAATPWMRIACDVVVGMPYDDAAALALESLAAVAGELSGRTDREMSWQVHALASRRILDSLAVSSDPADAARVLAAEAR